MIDHPHHGRHLFNLIAPPTSYHQQSTSFMISSSSILAPVVPHKGQGRVRCQGKGSTHIQHDGLVPLMLLIFLLMMS